ncbi:MAG: cbb3-type cytochrome c oxidase subunit I [Candidatus Sericytochromatia bacterium]|nr:cbb3-type cytochrome c oxidase subunit I [Candidatus Tanganyikabacteria bacterium]
MATAVMGGQNPFLARFWQCTVTGLKVDEKAVPVMLANAVAAVVFLLVGGILGLLIGLTRWEAVHLLSPNLYYLALTLHAFSSLIFWIIFMEMAILYFACTAVLNARLVNHKAAWLQFGLMTLGSAIGAVAVVIQGDKYDQPLLTSYHPLVIHPMFLVGVIIFAVGAFVGLGVFFATVWRATQEKTYRGSLPLVTFGAAVAAIIAAESLLAGAIAYIWQLLYAVGIVKNLDAEMYRVVWWLLGHGSQQINLAAMVTCWYLLIHLTTGAQSASEKVSRVAFVLYALFINLGSAHHILSDPGVTNAWRIWNASYAMYGAAMASMIHAFAIPAAAELALRRQGGTGLLGYWKKAPWGDPCFVAVALGVPLFGFMGGISGITIGTEQINMMMHNTIAITGHFHATVVAGTTLTFMGVTYGVIQLIANRELLSRKLACWSLWIFGAGMALFSMAQMWMGYFFGTPRRHPDVSSLPLVRAVSMEQLMAAGAVIAFVGGGMFILMAVGSLLWGKAREKGATFVLNATNGGQQMELAAGTPFDAPPPAADHGAHDLRGTMTLCLIFIATLAVVYATHWINLAELWKIG